MIRFFKNIYYRIRDHFAFKKKLKELKKRDPYIYK
jgi:hypothetical protein